MRHGRLLAAAAFAAALAVPAVSPASHSGPAGGPRDFATGSVENEFLIVVGEAHLSVAAHSDPAGTNPTGHIRAKGDPDGPGPMEPFEIEGPVTCVRVEGNRAAIKYVFKHAEGSAAPFEGGGTQIFLEDNGQPRRGQAVDAGTFDPPQPAGVFDPEPCDDPNSRLAYDQVESGNVVVHDASR